jgi:predicted DNA-binding ribbon-helix-helix protein
LDSIGVCYWTDSTFVIGWLQRLLCGQVHRLCYFCNAAKSFFYRHGAGRFFRLDVADLLQMGGGFMKSLVIKRSVVVAGHKTSVSLEDAFWKGLKEIAHMRDLTLSELVGAIDSEREYGNLSSALRLFVLDFYRTQLSDLKEGHDGSDQGSESSGAVRIRRMSQAHH